MRGLTLGTLARRLREADLKVQTFEYMSVAGGPEPAAERLRGILARLKGRVHVVGHSLGGLVALEAVRDSAGLPPGRVVCLGSPLRGSAAAQHLAGFSGGAFLLGRSGAMLARGVEAWNGARDVGVIAGRVPVGLGMIAPGLVQPHDGTVAVQETQLPGITDHRVLAATHTGLVFSDEVAQHTIAFLREGRFPQHATID